MLNHELDILHVKVRDAVHNTESVTVKVYDPAPTLLMSCAVTLLLHK